MSASESSDHQVVIAASPLFCDLEPLEAERLAAITRRVQTEENEVVFSQGDPGEEMFIILEGKVRISVIAPTGREIILGTLAPGEAFGEMCLLDGGRRSATVTAIEPSSFLVIGREHFVPFLLAHPPLCVRLLAGITRRLRATDEMIKDTLYVNTPSRLAKGLLALAKEYGQHLRDGVRINEAFSQEELAAMTGLPSTSVAAQLRAWKDQNLVTLEGNRLTITDPEELALLV